MREYTVYVLVASPIGYRELQVSATCKEAAAEAAKEQTLATRDDIEIAGFMVI